MMQSASILNFIPVDTNMKGLNFQYDIAKLKEFQDLKLKPDEDYPLALGQPLRSQELQSRMYNLHTTAQELLIFHKMGTGKTCTSDFIIQNFKGSQEHLIVVLSPSETLLQSYASDIAKACEPETFKVMWNNDEFDKKLDDAKGKCAKKTSKIDVDNCIDDYIKLEQKKASVNKVIKTYNLYSYNNFRKHLTTLSDDDIIEYYSSCVVIIDEAHLIRGEDKSVYDTIYKFLHLIKKSRKFLMTGTPIWDKIEDIAVLMNLILPEDENLKTGNEFLKSYISKTDDLTKEGIIELRKAFRGRISFLRELLTDAIRTFKGVSAGKGWFKHIVVYPLAMSEFQEEVINDLPKLDKSDKFKNDGFQINAREVSGFVAPNYTIWSKTKGNIVPDDPLYGHAAFDQLIRYKKETGFEYIDLSFLKIIVNNLEQYSNKFSFVANFVETNPKKVIWVYNKSVKTGSGVINQALILSSLKTSEGKKRFIWAKSLDDIKKSKSTIPRFIVISSEQGTIKSAKKINQILDFVSSEENKYGEYCQMVIGSKKASLGLTIKNARAAIIMTPHWNMSEIDQAIARGLRFKSHQFLPNKERYINIYLLASAKDGNNFKGEGYPIDSGFSLEGTIDINIYKAAEKKDYLSSKIYRIAKEESWDCSLAYERNVLKTDIENTRDSDYSTVNYKCSGYPDKHIDKTGKIWKYDIEEDDIINSNYNLYYSVDKEVIKEIKSIYSSSFMLSFNNLKQLISGVSDTKLFTTLSFIIKNNIEICDRYGFTRFLEEHNNIYFLKENRSQATIFDSWYINYPIISENITLNDIYTNQQLQHDFKKIDDNCNKKNLKWKDITALTETLNYRTKIYLIELLTLKNTKKALEIFNSYLHQTTDGIIYHLMFVNEPKGIKNITKERNLTRILDPNLKEWRYAHKGWELDMISSSETTETTEFDITKYENMEHKYKSLIKDKTFKIITQITKESGEIITGSGRVCTTMQLPDLYKLIYQLDIYKTLTPDTYITDPKKIKETKANLLKTFSISELYGNDIKNVEKMHIDDVVRLQMIQRTKKAPLCRLIEEWFRKEKLIE